MKRIWKSLIDTASKSARLMMARWLRTETGTAGRGKPHTIFQIQEVHNMKQVLYIDAQREGYAIGQVRQTMTVAELICYLEQFDEDAQVFLRHDGGYTYGGINPFSFADETLEDEEEDEEEE